MIDALILMLAILATSGAMIFFSGGRFTRETGYMSRHEYRRPRRQAARSVASAQCTPVRTPVTSAPVVAAEVDVAPVVVDTPVAQADRYARFEWLEVRNV